MGVRAVWQCRTMQWFNLRASGVAAGVAALTHDPIVPAAEVVQDLTNYKRRTAQLEEAMRAAGIPVPEAAPDVGSWAGPAGSSPEQQAALARQRNAIAVSSNLYPGSGPALDGPQRKPGEAPGGLKCSSSAVLHIQIFYMASQHAVLV